MDLIEWRLLVSNLPEGKRVGGKVYLHRSALPASATSLVERLCERAGIGVDAFHVVSFVVAKPRLTLLSYPGFETEGFPALTDAWTVEVATAKATRRSYRADANPPILHRKELMVGAEHPSRGRFEALTSAVEKAGLLHDSEIIGHRVQWEEELRSKGLAVEGHKLVTRVEDRVPTRADTAVQRHKTALSRRVLSTPMQALWRHGFLDGRYSVFDYGCGRGDDLAALALAGVEGGGWDPHFRPDSPKLEAQVVNIGFVLNVIEDPRERRDALAGAWKLTRHVLAVSALIGGRTAFERHRLFRDGVLTTRGTFQKYYTHEELRDYVAAVVGREPVSVSPGLYFVFRDDHSEQAFLEQRQGQRYRAEPLPPKAAREPSETRVRPRREPAGERAPRVPKPSKWALHADLLEAFWRACLRAGRIPTTEEFPAEAELREHLGVPKRVLSHLIEERGEAPLREGRRRRREDLLVFLALNLFERRKSFFSLSPATQTDIREHWGSYAAATEEARSVLFGVANVSLIKSACEEAASQELGLYLPGESLTLDTRLANELPAVLRVYIGCAGKLYGEVESADLVKIHVGTGKLSVMSYDDYEGREIPDLIERVKIDLRKQHVSYYQYGDLHAPQPLYFKSRYMNATLDGYEVQKAFDDDLLTLPNLDFSGYGPPRSVVDAALEKRRLERGDDDAALRTPVGVSSMPEGD